MTAGLIFLAVALVVVPAPAAALRARRLGLVAPVRRRARLRPHIGLLAVFTGLPVLACGGVGAIGAAVAAALTARVLIRRARTDRSRTAQRRALLDGLDVVIAELRVGAHPAAAAETAARECTGSPAAAFAACAGRGRLGGAAATGLRAPQSDVAAELDRVACAWGVAEQHGLALAELLAAARRDLVGRIRFRGRTEAALAGARASAAVLAGLPVLGIGLGQLMGAGPLGLLLGGGLGAMLLVIGVGLVCAGLLWTEALVRRVVVA